MKSLSRITAALVTGCLAALFTAGAPAMADEAAEAYIQTVLTEADPIFNAIDEQTMFDGIADLVDRHVDIRRVGLFTLGQYARQITDEQKATYLILFKDYATLIYQESLSNYSGQKLIVTNSVDRSARDIIVNSKIVDAKPGDQFANITVHWRVYRDKQGNLGIVDAGADNIWLAIEQRSQFTSIIANNGGGEQGMDALIAQLREQVGE